MYDRSRSGIVNIYTQFREPGARMAAVAGLTLAYVLCTASSQSLACGNESLCVDTINKLQIVGTQRAYLDSYELLNRSLAVYPTSARLWSLQAKLETFYLLQWSLAGDSIQRSLSLEDTANAHIFRGWLSATPGRLNTTSSEHDFLAAQRLAPEDFWPHFEMAAWLSHVVDRFEESRAQYEIVEAKASENSFLQFFFGLLLKYHMQAPQEVERGKELIKKALSKASTLPGQAAGNLAFQAQLLASRGRSSEALECCEFSGKNPGSVGNQHAGGLQHHQAAGVGSLIRFSHIRMKLCLSQMSQATSC